MKKVTTSKERVNDVVKKLVNSYSYLMFYMLLPPTINIVCIVCFIMTSRLECYNAMH